LADYVLRKHQNQPLHAAKDEEFIDFVVGVFYDFSVTNKVLGKRLVI